jgi:hypothetical protein
MPEHLSMLLRERPSASGILVPSRQMQIGHTIADQIIGLARTGNPSTPDPPLQPDGRARRRTRRRIGAKLLAPHFCLPCPGRDRRLLYRGSQLGPRPEGERPLHKCHRLIMHLRVPRII